MVDNTKPEIKITGNKEVTCTVKLNDCVLPKYEATDNYDGNITKNVTIEKGINNDKKGTYEVIYKVKDSSGNDIVYTFDSTGGYYGGTGKNISYNFTYVDFLLDSTTKATSSDVSITWDYTIDPVISKQTSYTYKKIGKTYNTSEVKQFDTSFMPTYTDA